MRLYLVRHGAAVDVEGRCIGHCDVPLSATGAESISRVSEWLPERPDRIISSDLVRAQASAHLLAQRWDCSAVLDARLREMSFGEWEGVRWDELERWDSTRLAAWMADWVRVRAPGGESFEDVVARAGEWFDEAQSAWSGETVVAVAHAGSIRAILCIWLGLPLERAFRLRTGLASVSMLSVE
jgi:alpha-ribazole phosphatase